MQQPKWRILFIINPVSGVGKKNHVRDLIIKHIDIDRFEFSITETAYAGHATVLASKAASKGVDAVVVAGGDGSVREVASALVNSDVKLGIIPNGSGNGLARHLKIPINERKSIKIINQFKHKSIDTYRVNGKFGCNLSGLGFDAAVAHEFAAAQKRGFLSYLRIVLELFPKTSGFEIDLKISSGTIKKRNVFLIAIANSDQFGSGTSIAPHARSNDGLLDICIVPKVSLLKGLWMGIAMLGKFVNKTGIIEYLKVDKIQTDTQVEVPFHIDGDPFPAVKSLSVEINPLSLKVIC